jgi:alpha-glucosidase
VGAGELEWIPTAPEVAAFRRGDAQCWVNTGEKPVELPTDATVVLASVAGTANQLPPDAAVWLVAD